MSNILSKPFSLTRSRTSKLALATLITSFCSGALAAPSESYNWQNVRIDGGGFVPGIIFNQKEANLIYARTDIGGAYRWDQATTSWIPLLDWVGYDNWGWNGVLSMATDAVDTNRVYAAVGMYTNTWDPNNGAIIRSSDKGKTWQVTKLPFKVGGNMPGRAQGERLAIDPNKNNILYFGAEGGNGLWKSTDFGATWAKVSSFTNGGTYMQDPADTYDYLNKLQGVTWVTFDPSSGTAGSASQIIYAGVADKANPVYRSTDGGATWAPIPGAPKDYLAHKGVYDELNDILYIASSDTGGPYDGVKGDVWKFAANTGVWTNISPIPSTSADLYFGYTGLTIDRKNPGTLMVASQVSWWPDAIFFRTTNGGASWTRIWDWAGYPSRTNRYVQDITDVPWLNFGNTNPVAPETSPKLGWMNESVEIDPHNSNRMMYGTGATIYGTENLTSWDNGGQIIIKPMVKGLEETAILDVVSPPEGAPVYSAMYDVGGFKHDDVTKVPTSMYTTPNFGGNSSIDFAELKPANMVRVGVSDGVGGIAITTSAGNTWWQGQSPAGTITSGGNVAISADGGAIVWAPGGAASVFVSTTFGSTWTAATGLPAGATLEADRTNANKFYAVANGTFYISTNKGASFTATAATGLPASARHFKAVYGREGDIWLAGGTALTTYGLWHSTDSGASFTKVTNVEEADNVTFGKAASGQSYPAIYIIAKVDGVRGVFRSNDQATSWVRINDDQHQYGNFGEAISGDPRIYGRLYLGTNGRGLLYGDSAGVVTPGSSSKSSVASSIVSSIAPSSVASSAKSSVAPSSTALSSVAPSSTPVSSTAPSSAASSAKSSVASSVSSSVSSTCAAAPTQCNWYGTRYPLCVTTTSGWGWENQKSCISNTTCATQPSPYGAVAVCGGTSSVASSVTLSSVAPSSKAASSVAPSSTPLSSTKSSVAPSSIAASSIAASSVANSSVGSGSISAKVTITNEWNAGYCGTITVTNTGASVTSWSTNATITGTMTSLWGANATQSGSSLNLSNLAWNGSIAAGKSFSDIGFCANK